MLLTNGEVWVPLATTDLLNLSTRPITCVQAQGPNKIIIPETRFLFIGKGGAVFSATLELYFTLGSLTFDGNVSFAGDVDKLILGAYMNLANADFVAEANQPLKIANAADVTGGANTSAMLRVRYSVLDIDGLV